MTVASRYRVDEPLGEGSPRAAVGTDIETDTRVVLLPLTADESHAMATLPSVEHAHLSRVLGLVTDAADLPVLVVEHTAGPTLREVLREVRQETPIEAVRSALRVADAVMAIHSAGAVHGCIHPDSLIVAPEGHAPPRLSFAPAPAAPHPYRSSARGSGPPSIADDTWAVTALLYEMLVGSPPPSDGVTNEQEVTEAGVRDAALCALITHGLAADESQRAQDLTSLRREMASWFVNNATDDLSIPPRGSTPPPLPPGSSSKRPPAANPPAITSGAPAKTKNRNLLPMVLAGIAFVATVGGVGAYFTLKGDEVEYVRDQKSSSVKPASSEAKSIKLSDVAVVGQHDAGLGDQMATCVAAWLPKSAFGKPPDLGWVCEQADPVKGAGALKSALVKYKPPGPTTDAMKVFSQLGWYEMAAYSVVYMGCCADPPPLKSPDPGADCARIDEQLNLIGEAVVANRSPDDAIDAFEKAAACEARGNRASQYEQKAPPTSAERKAFESYVKTIQGG